MAKQKVNKSHEVRKYLAAHPEEGPSAVAKALERYKVTPAYVSNIKMKMKQNGSAPGKRGRRGRPSRSAKGDMNNVLAAAEFIKVCGGIARANEALKAAEKVAAALD